MSVCFQKLSEFDEKRYVVHTNKKPNLAIEFLEVRFAHRVYGHITTGSTKSQQKTCINDKLCLTQAIYLFKKSNRNWVFINPLSI